MQTTKQLIIGMLEEVKDGTTVCRYMSRTFTKEEMIREIEQGSDEGARFCTDLLRVSRDIIIRRSVTASDPEPDHLAP